MNKRIQELLEQAISDVDYIHHDDVIDQELSEMFIPDFFAERFAELIIAECAKSVAKDFTLWEHVVLARLEKHFGVQD